MTSSTRDRFFSAALIIMTLVVYPHRREASASAIQVIVKPKPAPARLLADLKSRDVATRRGAINELGSLRARDAIRPLAEALLDKDASVREAAAFALGQMTDRRAIEPLKNVLKDKDPEVKASALFALGMTGERKVIQTLSNALGESTTVARSAAIAALGLMQDEEAVDELVAMLNDTSFDVRYDAVWALGQIGDPGALDQLNAALVNLDLVKIDDSMLEAYRQAVQFSIERLRQLGTTRPARPRRVTEPQPNSITLNVTRPVSLVHPVAAAPTERALSARVSGTVGVRVLVGADGRPVRAYVTRRLGYGLDQRAIEAVLQYRFDPAMIEGLPQTSWMNLDVKF